MVISISFLFVCFCTILQSATAIVFNLENDDYYTNKSEQSQKKNILNLAVTTSILNCPSKSNKDDVHNRLREKNIYISPFSLEETCIKSRILSEAKKGTLSNNESVERLERPGNLSGPKKNLKIKTCWTLAHNPVKFALLSIKLIVSFYHFQNYWNFVIKHGKLKTAFRIRKDRDFRGTGPLAGPDQLVPFL